MLSEFALSPAIFRTASYESSAVADICLRSLGPPLLEDCIVRNLHGGDWLRGIQEQRDSIHPKAKELIKKLEKQGRLVNHEAMAAACPVCDVEWEIETVSSHKMTPLSGMIFTQESKAIRHPGESLVACPETLSTSDFWKDRSCSRRIPRSIDAYCKLLEPLLRHANWIAYMDPHLDPSEKRYNGFIELLTHPRLTERHSKPRIEVHRVAWLGDGRYKAPRKADIEESFRKEWSARIKHSGITLKVFLWPDFHDRFFASNLLCMNWSNGFDTTTDTNARVTVGRLSRGDRDDLQLEFSENSNRHGTPLSFTIG